VALAGHDILANAATGSGKTAAFMLPVLERLLYRPRRVPVTRVLVLLPTRELAAQCHSMTQALAKHTDISVALILGGLNSTSQQAALRARPDIVIATPGRLIDHLRNSQHVYMEDVEVLILDEADRLLSEGFADELTELVKACPKSRQTLLFSATLNNEVLKLVDLSLNNPKRVSIDPVDAVVSTLSQEFVRLRNEREHDREAIVLALCKRSFLSKVIVFCPSKFDAHRMMIIFGLTGLRAAELHGNLTQTQRLEALDKFRLGEVNYLLCTDLAARGLDVQGVETVINMAMPNTLHQYIHRVGRTARAGRKGRSVTLIGEKDRRILKVLVRHTTDVVQSRVVPPQIVDQFRKVLVSINRNVLNILKQEREEKNARLADVEASRASNIMIHEEEIMRRPAKTWFQNPLEKKAAKERALAEHMGGAVPTDDAKAEEVKEEEGRPREREEAGTKGSATWSQPKEEAD